MILDFKVSNYRSIWSEAHLSLVAHGKYKTTGEEPGHTFDLKERRLRVLPVVGVFGPNASGKSNIIRAIDTLVQAMFTDRGLFFMPFEQFVFSLANRRTPTKFQIQFEAGGNIYDYQLSCIGKDVTFERLDYVPSGEKAYRFRNVFVREFEEKRTSTVLGPEFREELRVFTKFEEKRKTLLSSLLSLDIPVIGKVSEWLKNVQSHLPYKSGPMYFQIDEVLSKINENPELEKALVQLLNDFDIDIETLEKIDLDSPKSDKDSAIASRQLLLVVRQAENRVPIALPAYEESLGTQQLMILAPDIIAVLAKGGVLLVDELDSHLHPLLSHKIVEIFNSSELNKNRAQLVFTSHDYTIMGILRRDEIWLTERGKDKSTSLFSLTDFSVRKDLAIEKAYMGGRFGAIPIVRSSPRFRELSDSQLKLFEANESEEDG